MGDISLLLTEIFEALPKYEEAELYSRGRVSEVWTSKRIAHVMRRSAGKYRVNIARRPIDAVLDRLKIVSVAVEAEGDDENEDLTAVLNEQIYQANRLKLKLRTALDKAETYGDAYVICWPRPEGEDGVDVMVNDPKYLRVIYDPERPDKILFSGRTWIDSNEHRRVTIWRDGPTRERWISKSPELARPAEGFKDGDFEPLNESDSAGMTIEGSWFEDLAMGLGNPVFHLRTADENGYGVPEHESVYGTQNMLTKQIATMMESVDGYGFPFRYQLAKAGTTGNIATLDDDWDEDDSDGHQAPKPGRAEPGSIEKFWDTEAIGQLEPAAVANFLEPIGMTLRLSSVVSNTPLNYFDPSAASASGESKKEHEKPAVNKADNRKDGYDATLVDALAYAMALNQTPVPGIVIAWAPTETVDDHAEVVLAKSRQEAGVPLERTLVDLGYPARDVKEWIENATPDDQVLEHRVALLKELAQAAQALGAAASLGVIDQATARALITRMVVGTPGDETGLPPLPDPTTEPEGVPSGQ